MKTEKELKESYRLRGLKSSKKQKKPLENRVEEFRKIHGDKYEYRENPVRKDRRIIVDCEKHGEFLIFPSSHMKGSGCVQCKKDLIRKNSTKKRTEEERIESVRKANKKRITPYEKILEKFESIHKDRFLYDEKSYRSTSVKMKITCKKHGEFFQTPYEHMKSAHGCKSCASYSTSKAEKDWLDAKDIHVRQKKFLIDGVFILVDGFDIETNTIYEYLGRYWHGHPSLNRKDGGINKVNKHTFQDLFRMTEQRFSKLKRMGFNIIYRWENEDNDKTYEGILTYDI